MAATQQQTIAVPSDTNQTTQHKYFELILSQIEKKGLPVAPGKLYQVLRHRGLVLVGGDRQQPLSEAMATEYLRLRLSRSQHKDAVSLDKENAVPANDVDATTREGTMTAAPPTKKPLAPHQHPKQPALASKRPVPKKKKPAASKPKKTQQPAQRHYILHNNPHNSIQPLALYILQQTYQQNAFPSSLSLRERRQNLLLRQLQERFQATFSPPRVFAQQLVEAWGGSVEETTHEEHTTA